MPANRRAGLILGQQRLSERRSWNGNQRRGPIAQRPQERRQLRTFRQTRAVKRVLPAILNHATTRNDAVHADVVELQAANDVEQRVVLVLIDEIGAIDKAFRQGLDAAKEIHRRVASQGAYLARPAVWTSGASTLHPPRLPK